MDFLCVEKKLIIEIDGDVHHIPSVERKDREREAWLCSRGFTVLRYTNRQIEESMEYVLQNLEEEVPGS